MNRVHKGQAIKEHTQNYKINQQPEDKGKYYMLKWPEKNIDQVPEEERIEQNKKEKKSKIKNTVVSMDRDTTMHNQ